MTYFTRQKLAAYLQGTCQFIDTAADFLELDPDVDWEDEMLSAGLETCLGCGWWYESCELVHDDEKDTGYCEQCLEC